MISWDCWSRSRNFSLIQQKVSLTKRQQATVVKGSVEAMVTSAATLGLNILQDMNDPVFKMKFESLPPASKVGYRLALIFQHSILLLSCIVYFSTVTVKVLNSLFFFF